MGVREVAAGRSIVAVGLGVVCLVALVFAPAAQAKNEYELNDSRDTAYGPLKGGTDYTATFETENDVDWYVFYIRTYSQMEFSASEVAGPCITDFDLLDKDGRFVSGFDSGPLNKTERLQVTLPAGRYYFETEGCQDDRYRFRIDPAASITSSRECGEAIVAKDAVGPQLNKVNEELTEKGEDLTTAAAAVRKAKKVVRKLSKRPNASRYTKRSARRRLDAAKRSRTKVWREKLAFEGVVAQHQQAIAAADVQITTYC